MARSLRVQSAVTPVLDIMQTIPSFVYLIPVVMLLGIGKVPGLIGLYLRNSTDCPSDKPRHSLG